MWISQVHPNGIALKVRFPEDLFYVPGSTTLRIDGQVRSPEPTVNETDSRGDTYLVYYLAETLFNGRTGVMNFELRAQAPNPRARVEVDPDVDDIDIPNDSEFDIGSPEFSAETHDTVEIIG